MDRGDINELVMKWRKERALKYQARLMAKTGGKPVPANIDKILGLSGPGSRKQLSLETTVRPSTPPQPSTPQGLDFPPICNTPACTPSLRKIFSENGLSRRHKSAFTKGRLSSINIIKGLEKWFTTRGKQHELMRLQNSARKIPKPIQEQNHDNNRNSVEFATVAFERLNLNDESVPENEAVTPKEKKPLQFYLDLLDDTWNLIKMGYPVKHVSKLFDKIVGNYWDLGDHPVFYEIISLLNQSEGVNNFKCEEDDSLNAAIKKLKEKLKIVNLDLESLIGDDKENEGFNKNVPSFSIHFAVLESKKPDNDKKFLLTPVRRSTRPRAETPGSVKCVRTLSELSPTVANNVSFKPNKFIKF